MGSGCYAETGPLALHWRQVSDGPRGITLDALCDQVRRLPKHQLWRWAQAGDLPGDGVHIDADDLARIVAANGTRDGFAYTHYNPKVPANASAIRSANAAGFTISLSADTLAEADEFTALGVGPVVVVLPIGTTKPQRTPAGHLVTVCPAAIRDDVQCSNCGICAHSTRKAIIGFPAHGTGAKKAQVIFFQQPRTQHAAL